MWIAVYFCDVSKAAAPLLVTMTSRIPLTHFFLISGTDLTWDTMQVQKGDGIVLSEIWSFTRIPCVTSHNICYYWGQRSFYLSEVSDLIRLKRYPVCGCLSVHLSVCTYIYMCMSCVHTFVRDIFHQLFAIVTRFFWVCILCGLKVCMGVLVFMPSRQSPRGIMFLGCPSEFRPSFHPSVCHALVSDHYLCQFYRYLIQTLHTHYLIPMFVFRHLLIFMSPGQRSRQQWPFFCKNHFRSLSLSALQISSWDLTYTLPMYLFGHLFIFRSPGQRSRQQLPFLWKPFPVIIFVSFTDIFLRLCIHITYVGLKIIIDFKVTRSKVEATVTVFVKTISAICHTVVSDHCLCQFYRYLDLLRLCIHITHVGLQTPIDFKVIGWRFQVTRF